MATKNMPVMDKKQKAKWLRALRSGKYKQGHGALKTSTGYCCLGVAFCVLQPEEVVPAHKSYLKYGKYGLSEGLQKALAHANDGDDCREGIKDAFNNAGYDTMPKLSRRTGRASFKSIANWIEENL